MQTHVSLPHILLLLSSLFDIIVVLHASRRPAVTRLALGVSHPDLQAGQQAYSITRTLDHS